MNILYTAFNGKTNTSKILLDIINCNEENKLYLKNSFNSIKQLQDKIKQNNYDLIISLGQAPINNIKIETRGYNLDYYDTTYDYTKLKTNLEKSFNIEISMNAGNYLCNYIYYNGLKYINENKLKTEMIFIHIPKIKHINNLEKLATLIEKSVL